MTGSPWLVAIVILTAVNPARLAPSLTRLGVDSTSIRRPGALGDGPPAWAATALGAGTATLLLASLAWAATGILDSIDVSAPTLRVGAGLVLVAATVRDLVRPAPAAEPALTGWGAAVVPVLVPMVLRPEVGLLVMSAGPVEGLGVVVAALIVTSVLLTVLVSREQTPLRARVLAAGSWSATAITAAAGVALAVDGVYGI